MLRIFFRYFLLCVVWIGWNEIELPRRHHVLSRHQHHSNHLHRSSSMHQTIAPAKVSMDKKRKATITNQIVVWMMFSLMKGTRMESMVDRMICWADDLIRMDSMATMGTMEMDTTPIASMRATFTTTIFARIHKTLALIQISFVPMDRVLKT